MGKVIFPCGCIFETVDPNEPDVTIEDRTNVKIPLIKLIDWENIPRNCSLTYDEIFKKGDTKGVFQLENHLGQNWSAKVKPGNLNDIGALTAIIRPGCLHIKSGDPPKSMTQRFCDRKNKVEPITYIHPALEPILGETYGILVYQEQSIKIAQIIAGFNLQQADILRKSIGKKDAKIMSSLEQDFIDGCKTVGLVTEEQAKELFEQIRESQRYSFNKSHAISYGLISYWSAYAKAHYLMWFICNYLYGAQWKGNKRHEEIYDLINNAKFFDIDVCVPTAKRLDEHFYIDGQIIRFGLQDIKGVGDSIYAKYKRALKKIGKSISEWTWNDYLFEFSDVAKLSTIHTAFISCGALDFFGLCRRKMLYDLECWGVLTDKEKIWIKDNVDYRNIPLIDMIKLCCKTKKDGGGCHSITRVGVLKELLGEMVSPPKHKTTDSSAWIAVTEEFYLGVSVTCNKADAFLSHESVNTDCKKFAKSRSRKPAIMLVEIKNINTTKTKNGKNPGSEMAFLKIADSSYTLSSVVCFPEDWSILKEKLKEGNVFVIYGERGKEGSLILKNAIEV